MSCNYSSRLSGILSVVGLLFLFVFCGSGQAKLYKWVDANGTTHFSDVPPASNEKKTDLEAIDEVQSGQSPPDAGQFCTSAWKKGKYLYHTETKQLTDEQKSRIQQVLKGRDAHRQIWFLGVVINDYRDDKWLLEVDVYYLPTETKGRLRRGKRLSLRYLSYAYFGGPPAPSAQWPRDYSERDYYQVASPNYPFPPLHQAPDFRDIPFRIERGTETDEQLIKFVDYSRTLPEAAHGPIIEVFEGLKGFSTLSPSAVEQKSVVVHKENDSWAVSKRYGAQRQSWYYYKKIPAPPIVTSLTESKALEICRPALEARLRKQTGRTISIIKKTNFKTFPGSTKSLLTLEFLSKKNSEYGVCPQTARCSFVDEEIEELTIGYKF